MRKTRTQRKLEVVERLIRRRKFIQNAIRAQEHIANMVQSAPKGWEGFKSLVLEKAEECDAKLDAHRLMSTEDRALELERRATLRVVLRLTDEVEDGMGVFKEKLAEINEEIRKASGA